MGEGEKNKKKAYMPAVGAEMWDTATVEIILLFVEPQRVLQRHACHQASGDVTFWVYESNVQNKYDIFSAQDTRMKEEKKRREPAS